MKLLLTLNEQDINPNAPIVDTSKFYKRRAARAVVTDSDGRVALLYVGKHNYHKLPGGGIDKGEDIKQALDREILEETGCEAEVVAELGKVIEFRDHEKMHQVSYCYLAKQVGDTCQPSFTEKELSQQFEVVWADDINSAINILESDNPKDLGQEFMRIRDLTILRAAREKSLLATDQYQSRNTQ